MIQEILELNNGCEIELINDLVEKKISVRYKYGYGIFLEDIMDLEHIQLKNTTGYDIISEQEIEGEIYLTIQCKNGPFKIKKDPECDNNGICDDEADYCECDLWLFTCKKCGKYESWSSPYDGDYGDDYELCELCNCREYFKNVEGLEKYPYICIQCKEDIHPDFFEEGDICSTCLRKKKLDEYTHGISKTTDVTREFEIALTQEIGLLAAKLC